MHPPSHPPIELVLFDMDGVLADTEPLHLEALNEVLAGAAAGATLHEDEVRAFLGHTDEALFAALAPRFALPLEASEYARRKGDAVLRRLAGGVLPQPGLCELLLHLRMRGVRAAVASSSGPALIDAVVDALGLRSSFVGLYSAAAVGRGKPAPDLFLHAARACGVAPEACLVVEDAPAGIAAARAAGMAVVAVRTAQNRALELPADHVLESLEDFDFAALGES